MQYQEEAHKIHALSYHVILVVEYKQQVFLEGIGIINDTKEKIVEFSERHGVEIVEADCGIDHGHLRVGVKPIVDIATWSNSAKTNTPRFLREKHPRYFITTKGNVSIGVLAHYIEEQRGRLARAG
jgi:putative transposase